MTIPSQEPSASGMAPVALIAPDDVRRQALVSVLNELQIPIAREYHAYPSSKAAPDLWDQDYEVIVDLDSGIERGLAFIEEICLRNPGANVTACSGRTEGDLLIQTMRAGARELLSHPVAAILLGQALSRAATRRNRQMQLVAPGKIFVFAGANGGGGVTMLASNFGVALARVSRAHVAIVDLDIQLGEVAMALGLSPSFSIIDALKNPHRLDAEFLSTLMVRHESGAEVLAAPEEYSTYYPPSGSLDTLISVLRSKYTYVVLDAGNISGSLEDTLLGEADTLYLVVELTISSLRNARRIMSHIRRAKTIPPIMIVLNRFDAKGLELDAEDASAALEHPPNWKIPNDWESAQRSRNSGTALAMDSSPIMRTLVDMARAALGEAAEAPKVERKRFRLFR